MTFEGNDSFDDARLEGLILSRPSRFLATVRYREDVFDDDLETLMAFYRQNGFLQAQITDTAVVFDSAANHVDIAVTIAEGTRTYLEGVSIFGNEYFSDSTIMTHIAPKTGAPLRRPQIEDAVVALLALYAEHGFLDASVTPKVEVNDSLHLALLDFVIDEGVQYRVGEVTIHGADRTKLNVVLRELSFSSGDTVCYSELIRSQRRLYLTGLFESVFVRPGTLLAADSTARELRIEVREKQSSELSFSIGYGTIEKIRGRIELSTSNLSGTARKAAVALEANFIRQGIVTSFSEPWTLGTRWRTDISLYGRLQQEPAYHAEVVGGNMTLGRKLGRSTSTSLTYRMENTRLSRIDVAALVETPDPKIRSLMLTLSHDTRDNLFDPSQGWYVNLSNEFAGSFLKGSNSFTRSVLTLKRFGRLGRNGVLGSALELGWMEATGGSDEIPLNERFYTGGPTSLRAFAYQSVGPSDINGEPLGGRVKIVWNVVELRRAIYRMFGGAVFLEIGNVWASPADVKLKDLRVDLGTGLRINSPLGIVRLDYGVNLDRRGDEPATKVFLSMGQAF